MKILPIVQFENLTKIYRLPGFLKTQEVPGIESLSFEIAEGEIFGLIGLNGSGKTTTIRLLLGLIRPTSGRVLILGQEAAKEHRVRSHLGYLPESVSFPQALTPNEILHFFARIDAAKFGGKKKLEKTIDEVLSIVKLDKAADRKTLSFSKGMIQRLGIAQAILGHPRFLVLDEPASGLDPLGIVEMRELFLRLNRELGMTILFSSHSIGEVEKISHRAAVIAGSRLQRIMDRGDWNGGSKKTLEQLFLECVQLKISREY
ncbi:MAG: ABC transporter ATP-binding protein [Elusimicrobia bacterium]|nr:ABC transporter ATP-binding protein [Elusimicrobiota bacterium]